MNRIGKQGAKNTTVLVTCGGFRVINARLVTRVDGGFMDVHEVISSNELGVMDITHGKIYGKDNVGLAFVHDTKGITGANFVMVLRGGADGDGPREMRNLPVLHQENISPIHQCTGDELAKVTR